MYKTFNVLLDSDLPFPELPKITSSPSDSSAVVRFRMSEESPAKSMQPKWFHYWYSDQSKTHVAIAIARQSRGYLMRFPDLADLLLDVKHSRIKCHLTGEATAETLRHLVLDQVIPRFIGQQGNLILHASAVVLPNGTGIAFLGNSGWGKSTIASSFFKEGARLLTDDSLLLQEDGGRLKGIPAYAGSRLWPDSVDNLFADRADLTNVAHYSSKKRLILHNSESPHRGVELNALFYLADPALAQYSGDIKIQRIRGSDAIMTLIKRAFVLDVEDMHTAARQFASASRIASTSPAVYSLSYEHDYKKLDDVRAAILSVIGQNTDNRKNAIA